MKIKTTIPAAIIGLALTLAFTGCGHDHAHDENGDHDDQGEHAEGKEHADADHDGGKHDDHAEGGTHAEHDHEKPIPGPNGGRVITSVEPHLEFLILEDRKVRISSLGEDDKVAPIAGQTVSVIAGDRTNPTRLAFAPDGDSLLSDVALPGGNDFPLVVQIKARPDAETVREKFNANFSDCPTCDYEEYACICGHEEGDHGHEDEKK